MYYNQTLREEKTLGMRHSKCWLFATGILLPACLLATFTGCNDVTSEQSAGPANLSYSHATASYAVGFAITDTPMVSSGTVVSYSVSPALPVGLSLNASTGVISGIPTTVSPATSYLVTATNSTGSVTTLVNITVYNTPPSNLSYTTSSTSYLGGFYITANIPTVAGTVTGYSITPALPAGLSLNDTTGVISGTPAATSSATNYVITATN